LDVLVVLARVWLRRAAPAPVEQRTGRRHARRRWSGLGAADACQRADGQRGLCPRQRSNICCSLSHLGSFALHQPVPISAQLIAVPPQERDAIRIRRGDTHSNNLTQKARSCLTEDAARFATSTFGRLHAPPPDAFTVTDRRFTSRVQIDGSSRTVDANFGEMRSSGGPPRPFVAFFGARMTVLAFSPKPSGHRRGRLQ